jgi:nicotinate-nucleotide pyrophosphorylase (carboxylating)
MSSLMTQSIAFDERTRGDSLRLFELGLIEDVGTADLAAAVDCTTLAIIPPGVRASAAFVARAAGVVCGLQVCRQAIEMFSPELVLDCRVQDSQSVERNQEFATLSGEGLRILMMERTCLNFLCHLSGISTLTRQFVDRVRGTGAKILDTRKTTPGWRRVEKYAVACGGGSNHRMGLYDAIMIKDNHLAMYGQNRRDYKLSVADAIREARQWVAENSTRLPSGRQTILQIEVDTLEQLEIALRSSPDIVLLDNMRVEEIARAVDLRNSINRQVVLEASGGVNLNSVRAIAETGVERISVGALTHSAAHLDIGLDWRIDGVE